MGPPIHLIPWRKTMMKNVQNQNFKPEIATQISVQLVPQPVSLNFFYLYAVKGAFINYVYKRRGVGGQKKPNLVNVVCERPLIYFAYLAT